MIDYVGNGNSAKSLQIFILLRNFRPSSNVAVQFEISQFEDC